MNSEYVSRVSNLDELAKLDRETVEDFCNPNTAELLRNFVDETDIYDNMKNVEIELRLGRIVGCTKECSGEWKKCPDSHNFESGIDSENFEKIVDKAKEIFRERINFDNVLEKTKFPPRKKDLVEYFADGARHMTDLTEKNSLTDFSRTIYKRRIFNVDYFLANSPYDIRVSISYEEPRENHIYSRDTRYMFKYNPIDRTRERERQSMFLNSENTVLGEFTKIKTNEFVDATLPVSSFEAELECVFQYDFENYFQNQQETMQDYLFVAGQEIVKNIRLLSRLVD